MAKNVAFRPPSAALVDLPDQERSVTKSAQTETIRSIFDDRKKNGANIVRMIPSRIRLTKRRLLRPHSGFRLPSAPLITTDHAAKAGPYRNLRYQLDRPSTAPPWSVSDSPSQTKNASPTPAASMSASNGNRLSVFLERSPPNPNPFPDRAGRRPRPWRRPPENPARQER